MTHVHDHGQAPVSDTQRLYAMLAHLLDVGQRRLGRWQERLQSLRYEAALRLLYAEHPDDLFIVAYPKAGTTVMQMMLYQLTTDGDVGFSHIDAVVPWFDMHLVHGELAHPPGKGRLFKTHRTFSELPASAKYIYLVRNASDSCVSYYHHQRTVLGESLSLDTFVTRFLKGQVAWGSWFDHLADCSRTLNPQRTLVIGYDDLVNDLGGVVDRVVAFCGYAVDQRTIDRVMERCSVTFMKAMNDKFDPRWALGAPPAGQFIRRGAVGDWSNALSPGQAEAIASRLGALLRDTPTIGDALQTHTRTPSAAVKGTIDIALRSGGDLSMDGLQLLTDDATLQLGDAVRLDLALRGTRAVIDVARVRSINQESSARRISLQFEMLSVEAQAVLREWLSHNAPGTGREALTAMAS